MPADSSPKLGNDKLLPTLTATTETALHYTYLKEFRVEPCSLFKQHQCQQHRPYTCFYWHFANQRRRRPVRRKDGTFNYSPDIYCTKYDENSGICPDGEECPYLHRVAGDIERKYHLRYYKTALCVHSTDSRGQCSKNGPHCAFGHSATDMRNSIFDIREIQQADANSANGLLEHKDRTSFVVEDPVWQDQEHVLACYKTEVCKKPPRLCRQGYACPFYHNSKDRRRPPGIFKYRSTPCSAAKLSDEWADPDCCDTKDICEYCHTRTEQQFHPEIYKSTKCNDMLQHGYCPRGPFCAFAHTDAELHCEREVCKPPTLASCISPNLHPASDIGFVSSVPLSFSNISLPEAPLAPSGMSPVQSSSSGPTYSSVLKQRQKMNGKAFSRPVPMDGLSHSYPKAPGFERGQYSPTRTRTPENMHRWTPDSAANRLLTTSLNMGQLDLGCTLSSNEGLGSTPPATPGSLRSTSFSPFGRVHADNHGHVGTMDELSFDELPLATIAEQREDQVTAGEHAIYNHQSAPVQIPGSGQTATAFGSSPLMPASSSIGQDGPFKMSGSFGQFSADSMYFSAGIEDNTLMVNELQKAHDELAGHRHKLTAWEDGLKQARQACEAWKRDAETNRRLAQQADNDRIKAVQERDSALNQLEQLRSEMRRIQQLAVGQLNSSNVQVNVDQLCSLLQQENLISPDANCIHCSRHLNASKGSCPSCSIKLSKNAAI